MGCDIHILFEIFNNEKQDWELTKGASEIMTNHYKQELDKIKSDNELLVQATFSGKKERLEQLLNEFLSIPDWIDGFRDYNFFAMLSNVRNGLSFFDFDESNHIPYTFSDGDDVFDPLEVLPEDMTQETEEFLVDVDLHSHTVMNADEIFKLESIIDQNYAEKYIDEKVYKDCTFIVDNVFKKNVNTYIRKGYKTANMRFLMAYDN